MTMNKNVYQVVFLVDLSAGVPDGEDDSNSERILNFIRLGSLKILTYFCNKLHPEVKLKNLRWGFKFYNSVSLCLKVANHRFVEFTLKNFEEFENELDSRFEAERLKCHGLVRNKNAHSSLSEEKSDDGAPVDDDDHVDKLKKSLREICQDFQWDRPDICSPVRPCRGRGRGKHSVHLESQQYNYVFLFSPCPHTVGNVCEFCGTESPVQPSAILESFMPHSMYKAFYELSKINLFWIDVDCGPYNQEAMANLEGIDIIHSSLQMVGGGVLPINAILHLGTAASTFVTHLLPSKSKSRAGEAVAEKLDGKISSSVDHVGLDSKNQPGETVQQEVVGELMMSATRVMEYYTSVSFISPTIDDKGELGLLVAGHGANQQILGQVMLMPLVLGADVPSKKKMPSRLSMHGSFRRSTVDEKLKIALLPNTCATNQKSEVNEDQVLEVALGQVKAYNRESMGDTSMLRMLVVRGTLKQSTLPLEALQPDMVLAVTSVSGQGWDDFSFSQLLLQLTKLHLVLVVDFFLPHRAIPSTCVMQPLTSVLATLTFVRSNMNLVLEKLVSFGSKTPEKIKQQEVQTFVDNTVKSFLKNKKGKKKLLEAECLSQEIVDYHTNSDTVTKETFKPSFLESWFLSGIMTGSVDSLLKSAKERIESSDQGQDLESTTLKQLQQHYRNLASLSTITTSGTKTPKKMPGKAGGSPRKGNRKSPRKSTSPRKSPRKKGPLSNKALAPIRRSPRKAVLKRVKSLTGPIRSASIIDRSHQVVSKQVVSEDLDTEKGKAKSGRQPVKRGSASKLKQQEFQDETDLLNHLRKNYEEGMETSGTPLFCAQSIVNVALHFIRCTEAPEAEKKAQEFLREHLLMTSKQIREKHAKQGQSISVDSKIQEFQIQVLLYLEVETLLPGEPVESTVEEVVNMLRSMSFLKDPNFLTCYVNDVLLENYKDSLASFLGQIYDGLLLPMPAQLEALLSPEEDEGDNSMTESVMPPSYKSDTSVMNPSIPVESNMTLRSRKMSHFASFDAVPKRQIAVPNLKKPKDKEKSRMLTRSAKKKKVPTATLR